MSQSHPTSNQYLARKAQIEKDRCDRCVGLGHLTDGEPGDTYFNEWRCPECKGTGLKSTAHETKARCAHEWEPVEHYGLPTGIEMCSECGADRPAEKASEPPFDFRSVRGILKDDEET